MAGRTRDFRTLNSLSSGISYFQTLIARVSSLLLMLGLVTSTWNFLSDDKIFESYPWLQTAWPLLQAVAVDANLALIFMLLVRAVGARLWVRSVVYGVIGALLLLVAVAITDAESLRQALNVSLSTAIGQLPLHITVGLLTQARSIVVALLVAASGLDLHIATTGKEKWQEVAAEAERAVVVEVPETVGDLPETVVVEVEQPATKAGKEKRTSATKERVEAYLAGHPEARSPEIARELNIGETTALRYMRGANSVGERVELAPQG